MTQKLSTHVDSVQSNIKCRHMTQKVSTPEDSVQITESVGTWCRKCQHTWTIAKLLKTDDQVSAHDLESVNTWRQCVLTKGRRIEVSTHVPESVDTCD